MSSTNTSRFSGFFRKERPKFPQPELSVGILLQTTKHGHHLWDAIGPAHDIFKQELSEKVKAHLIKFGDSLYLEVRWTLSMVGRTKETACPTLVFLSPKEAPRRTIRQRIKTSGILDDYPGFATMDCDRPPGFASILKVGGNLNKDLPEYDTSCLLHTNTVDFDDIPKTPQEEPCCELLNWNDIEASNHIQSNEFRGLQNIEGARVTINWQGDDGVPEPKIATVGGVVQWGNRYFLMTVAHVFPGFDDSVFPNFTKSSEFEHDLDSCFDDEESNSIEVEIMSTGSVSSHSLNQDSDDGQTSTGIWPVLDLHVSEDLIEDRPEVLDNIGLDSNYTSVLADGEHSISATHEVSKYFEAEYTSSSFQSHDTQPYAIKEPQIVILLNDGMSQTIPSADSSIFSFHEERPVLDYALLEISRSQLDTFTGGCLQEIEDENSRHVVMSDTQEVSCKETTEVIVTMALGDTVPGQLLTSPTFISTHGSNYEELWTVRLQETLTEGDSGSWARDATTRKVQGHMIAGSPETGFAYIISMDTVLHHLRERFPGEWQTLDYEHESRCPTLVSDNSRESGERSKTRDKILDDLQHKEEHRIESGGSLSVLSMDSEQKLGYAISLTTNPWEIKSPENTFSSNYSAKPFSATSTPTTCPESTLQIDALVKASSTMTLEQDFLYATDAQKNELTNSIDDFAGGEKTTLEREIEKFLFSKDKLLNIKDYSHIPTVESRSQKSCKNGSLPPQIAQKASTIRDRRSCMRCWTRRSRCTPRAEGPCVTCLSLSHVSHPSTNQICYRSSFTEFLPAFFPEFLRSLRNVRPSPEVIDSKVCFQVGVSTGVVFEPMRLDACLLELSSVSQDDPRVVIPSHWQYHAPISVSKTFATSLKSTCAEHIAKMMFNPQYAAQTTCGDRAQLPFQVLKIVLRYNRAKPDPLIQDALALHAICYFMGHLTTFSSDSGEFISQHGYVSSLLLNRQIKYAMAELKKRTIRKVLEKLEMSMRRRNRDSWGPSFCALLLLCLCMESIQIAIDVLVVSSIKRQDPESPYTRKQSYEASLAIEEHPFGKIQALFHDIYRSRESLGGSRGGLEGRGFNPLTDVQVGKMVDLDRATADMARSMYQLISDLWNEIAELSGHPIMAIGDNVGRDEIFLNNNGRLAAKYLRSFFEEI